MKTVAVTPEAQVKVELEIPQLPLEDVKVKPEPTQSQLVGGIGTRDVGISYLMQLQYT